MPTFTGISRSVRAVVTLSLPLILVLWCLTSMVCSGEPAHDSGRSSTAEIGMTNPRTQRIEVGVVVRGRGTTTGIVASLPVPMSWPEQDVMIVDQQQSRNVRSVRFRVLDKGVKQMTVSVARLTAGEEATATVTMEITKRDIVAPSSTLQLRVPERVPRNMTAYLKPSPYIESDHPDIVQAAALVVAGQESGWSRAEAIFDWVREKIEYRFDPKIKSAHKALEDGYGDCEEMTSLFIAMCRSVRIPARAVWVPGHCYPEFYLEDAQGNGHWYPCQAAGDRSFGAMPEGRPILQKGDNFRVPGDRQPQRYVKKTLAAKHADAAPEVEFVPTHWK